MRISGLLIIFFALGVPLIWFIPMSAKFDSGALFSQYLGSAALIAMGLSQLLATRISLLETVFGGLDRIYVLHKWLGVGAIVAVLLHDTIDADIRGTGLETFLTDLAESLGEFSLYAILILVVLSIATFVPYHLWKFTHKFMGALFALSAFHYVYILKPFAVQDPVGLYVLGFCILGIACYFYTLLPLKWLKSKHRYEVRSVEQAGDATAIFLTPVAKGLRCQPGQFAFVEFETPGLSEAHPFTVSKVGSDENALRFTIKSLGDFTAELGNGIKLGSMAKISGPFGHFQRRRKPAVEIWIAGGIGITPFASWANALKDTEDQNIQLFYCVRDRASAAHLDELEELAAKQPGFHLHLIESSRAPRLSAVRIAEIIDRPIAEAKVYYCGPASMRDSLHSGLRKLGLKRSRFVYEEFEMRSGIGVRRFVLWFAGVLSKRFDRFSNLQQNLSILNK